MQVHSSRMSKFKNQLLTYWFKFRLWRKLTFIDIEEDTSYAENPIDNPANPDPNPPTAAPSNPPANSPKEAFQLSRSDTMKGSKMLQLSGKIIEATFYGESVFFSCFSLFRIRMFGRNVFYLGCCFQKKRKKSGYYVALRIFLDTQGSVWNRIGFFKKYAKFVTLINSLPAH